MEFKYKILGWVIEFYWGNDFLGIWINSQRLEEMFNREYPGVVECPTN